MIADGQQQVEPRNRYQDDSGNSRSPPRPHMDLRASLAKARDLLTPHGAIAVVGISANISVRDWVWAVMCVAPTRLGSWWHSETRDVGVVVTDPREGLDDVRRVAGDVLPGVSVRRALYYRYLFRWANDSTPTA